MLKKEKRLKEDISAKESYSPGPVSPELAFYDVPRKKEREAPFFA